MPIQARGKLQTAAQFENIILKSSGSGATVRIKDVARVELAAESADVQNKLNGRNAGALAIVLADGANALEVAAAVEARIRDMEPDFPYGIKAQTSQDSVPFVKASVKEVVNTLLEAIVLVVVVIYVFLQSWRATLIPAVAVPVVLMGTFGVLALFGHASGTVSPVDPLTLMSKGSLYLTRPTLGNYLQTREELLRRAGDVLGWLGSGALKARIDRQLPLSEAGAAQAALAGRATTGKVVLIP